MRKKLGPIVDMIQELRSEEEDDEEVHDLSHLQQTQGETMAENGKEEEAPEDGTAATGEEEEEDTSFPDFEGLGMFPLGAFTNVRPCSCSPSESLPDVVFPLLLSFARPPCLCRRV